MTTTEEILYIADEDQALRKRFEFGPIDDRVWKSTHERHRRRFGRIIERIGWPTTSKVGPIASKCAWLIAQHADHDIGFQKHCLELMQKEPEHEVQEVDIAYLYDRICVNEGRPQFFGTQFTNNAYGAYGPHPIEFPETVDERRMLLDLEPMTDYKLSLAEKYPKIKKRRDVSV